MKKYPKINEIQKKITSDGSVHLTFHSEGMKDIIHPYSVPGYEYLSGSFVEFLDRFRSIIPGKIPIVLEIAGQKFSDTEKEIIDKAIWMHYGLYLSEADMNLKKIRKRMILFFILMILSSAFLFLVSGFSEEVVTNYGYVLFWFFAYRFFTHLILDCYPIYKEYHWYRRLASLKLIFSDGSNQPIDIDQLSRETAIYKHEADIQTREHLLVDKVLMEDTYVSLGCRITDPEEVICPSGVEGIEIVSDEMTDYLLGALPFIKRNAVTKLEIEGEHITEATGKRIAEALRNHLVFLISAQEAESKTNRNTSILFAVGLFIATLFLFFYGKQVNVAVHEFILVAFWFFADYLLEFLLLSSIEISSVKKTLEKLANMEITCKNSHNSHS